jgi:hypothetical protein
MFKVYWESFSGKSDAGRSEGSQDCVLVFYLIFTGGKYLLDHWRCISSIRQRLFRLLFWRTV